MRKYQQLRYADDITLRAKGEEELKNLLMRVKDKGEKAGLKLNMLTPWKESYDKPRQLLKSRDITLPTKVHVMKAMVFPVVIYGCESWTLKKTEC